jgi:cell division protein FtsA
MADQIKVAIDIGTTKICVLVAKQVGTDFEVLGMGKYPSEGLEKGVVVNIAKAINSIKAAVKEAEIVSGQQIESAAVGISGSHINSLNSNGIVPVNKTGKIKQTDIYNVLEAARAVPIAEGQQILHVLPQSYAIDGLGNIQDPLGMHGVRLEVQAHIITGSVASVQNIISCCEAVGIKVTDVILEQLASAAAVLNQDECQLGVAVLDIGGGTSDFAIYQHNSIMHTRVLPVAGNHFTHDVAVGLQTTLSEAERVKHMYGLASDSNNINNNFSFEVLDIQGQDLQTVQQDFLTSIIEPRAEELVLLVLKEIETYKLRKFMTTGLVLTGGGSLLAGLPELATKILQVPVRLGAPRTEIVLSENLSNPIYATGYGLLIHLFKSQSKSNLNLVEGPTAVRVFYRMRSWVSDLF